MGTNGGSPQGAYSLSSMDARQVTFGDPAGDSLLFTDTGDNYSLSDSNSPCEGTDNFSDVLVRLDHIEGAREANVARFIFQPEGVVWCWRDCRPRLGGLRSPQSDNAATRLIIEVGPLVTRLVSWTVNETRHRPFVPLALGRQ